jgi:hypothetical protein
MLEKQSAAATVDEEVQTRFRRARTSGEVSGCVCG